MRDLLCTDPKTHGIANRAVRRVKDGTSSVSVQSGLQASWWAEAMESVIAIFKTCKTYQQMARRLVNVGSIHHFMDRFFSHLLEFLSSFLSKPPNSPSSHHHTPPRTIDACVSVSVPSLSPNPRNHNFAEQNQRVFTKTDPFFTECF